MPSETFVIKSLYVQNTIMLTFLGLILSLLIHSILKKRRRHVVVFSLWVLLLLWFFNSPFFGFSVVSVGTGGIRLNYGILSFRNDVLPLESEWRIETYMGGIKRNKRLYYISIGGRQSMRVRGMKDRLLLERIGEAIERMKKTVVTI